MKTLKKLKTLLIAALCLTGAFSIRAQAVDAYMYLDTGASIPSSKTVYVPSQQTQVLNGSSAILTFDLKAAKGRKIVGTVSDTTAGTTSSLTFNYNKKGVLTAYTYDSTTYSLKNGMLVRTQYDSSAAVTYKYSNKKYTRNKVLKSASALISGVSFDGYRYENTYYTSGRKAGLVKTSSLYSPANDGQSTLLAKITYTYTTDSHGNVTRMTQITRDPVTGSTSKLVVTTKYKKLTLKK